MQVTETLDQQSLSVVKIQSYVTTKIYRYISPRKFF